MELNNTYRRFNFDPLRYEGQLSTFGKKVLKELVKKWNRDKILRDSTDSTLRYRNASTPTIQSVNRKIITFNPYESPIRRSSPPMEDPINFAYSLQTPAPIVNNNLQLNGPPNIPCSNELVQTFDPPRNNDLTTHDLLNTVYDKHDINNLDVCSDNLKGDINEPIIDWDNMFDTELFTDIDINSKNTNNETTLYMNSDAVNPCIINDPTEIEFKIPSIPPHTKKKQKTKRKTQPKITDAVPKKVKKVISDNKNTLRKPKYTTIIKNWLDDVDPSNYLEEDSIKNTTKANNYKEVQDNNSTFDLVIEKHKDTVVKKVVQARLANKDGIMKYSKPKKTVNASNNKIPKDLADTNSANFYNDPKEVDGSNKNIDLKQTDGLNKNNDPRIADESKNSNIGLKNKNKTNKAAKQNTITNPFDNTSSNSEKIAKEKKSKPKFIAPIKSQIPVKDVTYDIINFEDSDKNIELLSNIKDEEIIVVLIYSNGFSQLNKHHTEDSCDPEGLLINVDENFYYLKGHKDMHSYNKILKIFSEKNTIVCFNGKHILMYLKSQYDLDTHNLSIIDIQIGGCILQPDTTIDTYSDLQKAVSYTPQYTIATECHLQKTAWYITTFRECYILLVEQLKGDDLWSVFVHIEMKLLPIIADMENQGVKVDVTKLKSMEDTLLTKMKEVEQKCYKAAGKTFQINSTVQVRTIIYDELGLDAKCNVQIRETICQGAKSTSEAMLRSLTSVHPLPKLILDYRHLHKAHATFLAGIAQHVRDGIVKPTWVQTAAVTGRIASNNPNLQAIPKSPFSLSLFPETDDKDNASLLFRSVYTCEAGWQVLAADFQHVECRVWAHIANDEQLLAALAEDTDFFRQLAQHWLKKPESEISIEDRERTKRMVYATLYGAGCRKLMDILNLSYEQTLAAIASFNRTFPTLKSFGSRVISMCAAEGRLRSVCGRLRPFPNIDSQQHTLKAQAERQAVNFVVQGSAADLCKLAMVRTVQRLRDAGVEHRLVLQIHDELVFHVKAEQLDVAAGVIRQAMEGCGAECGLRVRLPVAVAVGDNWAELTHYSTPRYSK